MEEIVCPDCNGDRKVFNPKTEEYIPCTTCNGDGSISKPVKPNIHNEPI